MKKAIIIVDKQGLSRELLEQIFKSDYETILVDDGKRALVEITKHLNNLAAVFLDWDTPVFNGNQVLQVLKQKNITEMVPIILTTDREDKQVEVSGYGLHAATVLHKPYAALAVRKQCVYFMELFERMAQYEKNMEQKEKSFQKQQDQLKGYYDKLLDGICSIVEYRLPKSERHIKRVRGFTRILAAAYKSAYPEEGIDEAYIETLVRAASVHDIGKIAVSDSILMKPGRLTEDERQIMMSHTTKGGEILEMIREVMDDEMFEMAYDICRWHHERHDGKGYPDGLKGDEIPLAAKIVSLVDVYDALVSDRIYKKAYDADTAFHMIMNKECGVFDPKLMKCFETSRKIIELFSENNFD